MLITFSGLDGAGKSTLAHCLQARLEKQNRRAVVLHFYHQVGTYAFLCSLRKRYVGSAGNLNGTPKQNSEPSDHPKQEYPRSYKVVVMRLARSLIWNKRFRQYIYVLDLIIFFFYRLYREKIKNQVLIMDRYFYDRLVDVADGRGSYNRFLAMLTPTPDVAIYLDITPQEALARKREQSLEYLTRRWVSYNNLFPQLQSSVVLAGNNDLNANVGNLERVVRERMNAHESGPENLYATLILRLLLSDTSELSWPDDVKWADFIQVAKRNVVLVRIADRLKNVGLKPPEEFFEALNQERWRIQAKTTLIHKINYLCSVNSIEHMFVKDFQHYPDMGHDVDLWVSSRSTEVDARIVKALDAAPKTRGLHNKIAGTTNYKVDGCESPLEIHHGRMGSLGEHASYLGLLLENARLVEVEGIGFLVPSPEDQLIVQGMQRVYERQYLRISDIVYTISSIREDQLDWDYILRVSRQLGTFHGLCCYLSYADQIYRELFKNNLFSLELTNALDLAGWGQVEFRNEYFRFPSARVASIVYLKKFRTALLTNNWDSASRLCLLPLVAVASVLRRRLGLAL